ncbi:hypothetical protein AGMMS49525_01950 [Bacteroidia bacterium]|nr:hypothetical protein AGMMS49525_01950 [Bacteroidia bacterium]
MIQFHEFEGEQKIAEILEYSKPIKSVDDAIDYLGDCYYHNCIGIVIPASVLDSTFFELKTGLAGEILQKFTTYKMKVAIIGDFSNVASVSLRDFIRESNSRKSINFVASVEDAFEAFAQCYRR